jgi:hypothetical protein
MLAQCLGHRACRQGHRVEFTNTSRLLSDQHQPAAQRPGWRPRRRYVGWTDAALPPAAAVVLDDFAMREFTSQQADDLYELIGERSRAGSMILTNNRAPQDWYPLFPNPVLAEGALDRLLSRSHHLVLEGAPTRHSKGPIAADYSHRIRDFPFLMGPTERQANQPKSEEDYSAFRSTPRITKCCLFCCGSNRRQYSSSRV